MPGLAPSAEFAASAEPVGTLAFAPVPAGGKALADLDLSAHAKAGADSLVKDFGSKIVFTSGRRNVKQQAAAMAPHVAKDRQWITKTYADPEVAKQLQAWVDAHPEATTAAQIAAGLESVMNGWSSALLVRLSRHLTGDAFDIAPVAGADGDAIQKAIPKLQYFNKFLPKEGDDIVWHVQFD